MTIQQEFWRNPNKLPNGLELPKNYVECCKPDYYTFLHPVSEYIVNTLRRWSPKPIESISVLELGCNSGRNLNALSKAGFGAVRGIEINPECKEIASEYFPAIKNKIIIGAIENVLPECGRFDIIFTQGVLMHIPHDTIDRVANYMFIVADIIVTTEVEDTEWRNVKFARNYGDLFKKYDMRQIYKKEKIGVPYIGASTTRVFSSID